MHTSYSDGTDNVEQILAKVIDKNIEIFAITDHDTFVGCEKMRQDYSDIISKNGLIFLNGIEFSTEDNGESVHILAYGFDIENPKMIELVNKGKQLRLRRIKKRIELLNSEFNIQLSDNELASILSQQSPSKVHIANILIQRGFVGTLSEILVKYMSHNLPDCKLTTKETLATIGEAGALSVYAHPLGGTGEKRVHTQTFKARVERFKCYGLDAIECYYSIYNEDNRELIKAEAKRLGLKLSGGSDYHGTSKDVKLGCLSSDGIQVNDTDVTLLKLLKPRV